MYWPGQRQAGVIMIVTTASVWSRSWGCEHHDDPDRRDRAEVAVTLAQTPLDRELGTDAEA